MRNVDGFQLKEQRQNREGHGLGMVNQLSSRLIVALRIKYVEAYAQVGPSNGWTNKKVGSSTSPFVTLSRKSTNFFLNLSSSAKGFPSTLDNKETESQYLTHPTLSAPNQRPLI